MSRRRRSNDLIRIEDAIKVLCRRVCHPGMFCPDAYCNEMWELLEDVERVDAVEVVRCKDCRFHGYNTYTKVHYCRRPNVVLVIKENDFCKYGERKDGEANENH